MRSQLDAYRESLNRPDGDSVLTLDSVADALISTAVTVATLSDTGPVRDATSMRQHVDSKAMKETRRKKIAMGHKFDDHEDEKPTWLQQMY